MDLDGFNLDGFWIDRGLWIILPPLGVFVFIEALVFVLILIVVYGRLSMVLVDVYLSGCPPKPEAVIDPIKNFVRKYLEKSMKSKLGLNDRI
ncbi:hypothetical protein Lal_00031788 [Lupinus albus]|nr:hypothetical protein Lal_00031788 [Lupinus albus]